MVVPLQSAGSTPSWGMISTCYVAKKVTYELTFLS